MRTTTFILSGVLAVGGGSLARVQAEPVEPAAEAVRAELPACLAEPVMFRRFGVPEPQVVSLTDCEQRPNPAALAIIGALALPPAKHEPGRAAEPSGTADPASSDPAASDPAAAAVLNPQLLVRLQQIASRFPDRAIEIVSGYRTRARATSRHRSGDALDLRVEGIDNEELSIFARTLEETGVGYYPNSTFVHIDVRAASAYWVDRSAPGERPDYVRDLPGAVSSPDTVRTSTPADAEQDLLSAQLARTLLDVHGPELPAPEDEAPTDAQQAEPVLETAAAPAEPTAAVAPVAETPAAETPVAATPAAQAPADEAPTPATPADTAPADETPPADTAPAEEAPPADAVLAADAPAEAAGGEPPPSETEDLDDLEAAQLEAEIQTLLERALVVMGEANPAG